MPPSNNEDLQAVRITEAGSFERIRLDRNKVLDQELRARRAPSFRAGVSA
jgi:hypothetical protein